MYKSDAKVLKVGDILPSKMTGDFKIVSIKSARHVEVSFVNNPEPVQTITATRARIGNVSDPYFPTVESRGYLGVGEHECYVNGKRNKIYIMWRGMLARVYSDGNTATDVCKEWWNFQTFADWYIKSLGDITEDMRMAFDLLDPTATIYQPETTTLVPVYIHKILINNSPAEKESRLPKGVSEARDKQGRLNGTYKAYVRIWDKNIYLGSFPNALQASRAYNAAKEKHVRDMAKKYKAVLTPDAYKALHKWRVPTQ